MRKGFPAEQGLYSSTQEKDSCGVGFVCNIKGQASNQILRDAESMNCAMEHRGGVGYEVNTGDGAGILTSIPHAYYSALAQSAFSQTLGERGEYGVGIVFMPDDPQQREECRTALNAEITRSGQQLVGWRTLPTDPVAANIGQAARSAMPVFEQVFVRAVNVTDDAFERQLYAIRKRATQYIRQTAQLGSDATFYVCSLSSKIIVHKGMLTPKQLFEFYTDLQSSEFAVHLAMVHSRFSTNTFPSWDRAQPNRFMSHNGEINTLLGNVNAMNARQGNAQSQYFPEDLQSLFPIVEPDCSDSGNFDNVLEFLTMNGRSLHESVMLMIPEAWQNHATMPAEKKAFYEYHSCFMEPWDGPASIAFTNGDYMGAVLLHH